MQLLAEPPKVARHPRHQPPPSPCWRQGLVLLLFLANCFHQGHDHANNRLSETITGSGPTTIHYYYNALNQLTSCNNGTRNVAFSYDANGNRTTRIITGGSDSGTDTYSYDIENRLIGLVKGTAGGPGTYAYAYDYRTRRIVRDESAACGVLTNLVFSGGTSVQEYSGSISSANLAVEYIRGSDYGGGVGGILYTVRGGTQSYTHANRRGDIVMKTDGSGNLMFQDQYDGNGDQVATLNTTPDRQKNNSKDVDPTGLINEGMRYTDLEYGLRIFLTRDPAGMIDGPNEYTYVRQNPWTHFDPEGLDTTTANPPPQQAAPQVTAQEMKAATRDATSVEVNGASGAGAAFATAGAGLSLQGVNTQARQNGVKLTLDVYGSGQISEEQAVTIGDNVKNMPLPPVDASPASGEHNWNEALLNTQTQLGDAIGANEQSKGGGASPTKTALQNKTETDETVHRIGGGSADNLALKPQEQDTSKANWGASVLLGGTPQEAADQMRTAFPKAKNLQAASNTVGSSTVAAIEKAGYTIYDDPSMKLPNHAEIQHPGGPAGYAAHIQDLSKAFQNSSTPPGQ